MKYKLSSLINTTNGYPFKSERMNLFQNGLPIIKIKELKNNHIEFSSDTLYYAYNNGLQKYIAKKDDILIALTGNPISKSNIAAMVGRCSKNQHSNPAYINQRVCKVYSKSNLLLNKYLFYFLSRNKTIIELAGVATGSANQANISSNDILNLEIDLPTLDIQQHIVDTIGSVDNLIEKYNKLKEELLQYGQNFYEQEIRKKYIEKNILDFNLKYGISIVGNQRKTGNYNLYASNGLVDYLDRFNAENAIIFGCRGSIGNVFYCKEKCFVLNTAFYICSQKDYGNLYFSIMHENGMKIFSTGAAQPQITFDNLKQAKLKFIYSNKLNSVLDLSYKYETIINKLKLTKQILLKKYFG